MAPKLKLYELKASPEDIAAGKPGFSPYVWRTKLALNWLGIEYETQGLTFTQIRGEFAERANNKDITVPTIETEDGKVITDSWDIALYLEEKYARPAGKTLFGPSPVGENFCQFIMSYTGVALGTHMRPLIVPAILPALDPASAEYFWKIKVWKDASKRDRAIANSQDPAFIQGKLDAAQHALGVIDFYLEQARKRHPDQKHFFLQGGDEPTMADFIVGGMYAFSQMHKDIERVWRHEELPHVGMWLDDLVAVGAMSKEEIANIAPKTGKSHL